MLSTCIKWSAYLVTYYSLLRPICGVNVYIFLTDYFIFFTRYEGSSSRKLCPTKGLWRYSGDSKPVCRRLEVAVGLKMLCMVAHRLVQILCR